MRGAAACCMSVGLEQPTPPPCAATPPEPPRPTRYRSNVSHRQATFRHEGGKSATQAALKMRQGTKLSGCLCHPESTAMTRNGRVCHAFPLQGRTTRSQSTTLSACGCQHKAHAYEARRGFPKLQSFKRASSTTLPVGQVSSATAARTFCVKHARAHAETATETDDNSSEQATRADQGSEKARCTESNS